jgi:hypothetical protein
VICFSTWSNQLAREANPNDSAHSFAALIPNQSQRQNIMISLEDAPGKALKKWMSELVPLRIAVEAGPMVLRCTGVVSLVSPEMVAFSLPGRGELAVSLGPKDSALLRTPADAESLVVLIESGSVRCLLTDGGEL